MRWLWELIWKDRRDVGLAALGLVLLPIAAQFLAEVIQP